MSVKEQRVLTAATIALLLTAVALRPSATDVPGDERTHRASAAESAPSGFEVWLADQSDTRPGYGGQLVIYEGAHLHGKHPETAAPIARIDLGGAAAELCVAATGRRPVRPHMIAFNREQSHAILSFVASGHIVIFNAETRAPLACMETTVGSTGTRQAHAAFPSPDGSFILVANQNGKRLERIDADFTTNTFVHNPAATLDLATCTTPSGAPCEHPDLRPINWPICPVIDSTSTLGFVTLRGGGLFVINARTTPISIVGEYDRATVRGNGCGGIETGGHMYINSGGSPVNVSGGNPHHPDLYASLGQPRPTRRLRRCCCRRPACPTRMGPRCHGMAATCGCSIAMPTWRRSSTSARGAGSIQWSSPAISARTLHRTLPIDPLLVNGCSWRCAARCRSAATRTTPPAPPPDWASFR
jgi:hypothetical protein